MLAQQLDDARKSALLFDVLTDKNVLGLPHQASGRITHFELFADSISIGGGRLQNVQPHRIALVVMKDDADVMGRKKLR